MIYTPEKQITPITKYEDFCQDFRNYVGERWNKYYLKSFAFRGWSCYSSLFHTELKKTDIVLDVGGACSYFTHYISQFVEKAYVIDPLTFESSIEWEKSLDDFKDANNLVFIKESAVKMPFPDNFFDVIYSISALEHCYITDDDLKIIDEIKRVLKAGGVFTGTVDFNPCTDIPQGAESICRTYTYKSLYERIIDRSGMMLAGGDYNKYDPIPEEIDNSIREIFFKLFKT